jgi:hypothetical protein
MNLRFSDARRQGAENLQRLIAKAVTRSKDPEVLFSWEADRFEKTAVAATASSEFGDGQIDAMAFFTAVREQAVLFRLGARRAGFRTRTIASSGVVGSEVAEGASVPVAKVTFAASGVTPRKWGAVAMATRESLEVSPDVERAIFDDLVTGVTHALDTALLTGSGSLVDGLSPVAGGSPADAAADMKALVDDFAGDLSQSVVVLGPDLAAAVAGDGVGRDLTVRGGTIAGLPALISRNSPSGQVTLIDASGLLVAYDEAVVTSVSQEGVLQADDAPSSPPTSTVVGLWQCDTYGFKAILSAGWLIARDDSVSVLTGASW